MVDGTPGDVRGMLGGRWGGVKESPGLAPGLPLGWLAVRTALAYNRGP